MERKGLERVEKFLYRGCVGLESKEWAIQRVQEKIALANLADLGHIESQLEKNIAFSIQFCWTLSKRDSEIGSIWNVVLFKKKKVWEFQI